MAPTVCMTDFPETGNSHVCARRRQRIQDRSISKRQKVELKKVSNKTLEIQEMTLSHPLSPISRSTDAYVPIILRSSQQFSTSTPDNQWKMAMRRDGLVDVFIRTIALVRRNHILQRRVNALREETQNFISGSESHSEENENMSSDENSQVSSTTENNSRSSSLSTLNSKINPESIKDSRTDLKSKKPLNASKTDRDLNKVSSTSQVVIRTQKTSNP